MSSPRVSFIIPLFNCLPLTQAMLASLRTTLPKGLAHEIILVDDGSTDGTREWMATLHGSGIRSVLNERNCGYAATNNRGAALAQGEYLALLNNDLILTPHWLEPMLAVQARLGPRAGAVGNLHIDANTGALDHAGIFINTKGKPEHARDLSPLFSRRMPPLSRFRHVDAVTGACLLVHRSLWEKLQGFDEDYVNGCEDVDFCLRASARGHVNVIAPRSQVGHHVSSSPGRKLRDEQNTRRLMLRWRDTLVRLAARRWCREHLAREWTHAREPKGIGDAAKALGHALGFSAEPPAFAIEGMHAAIEQEMARWKAMGIE